MYGGRSHDLKIFPLKQPSHLRYYHFESNDSDNDSDSGLEIPRVKIVMLFLIVLSDNVKSSQFIDFYIYDSFWSVKPTDLFSWINQ